MRGEKNGKTNLFGKPVGKRPLGMARIRWEDNIKIDLKETECECWTGFIRQRMGPSCRVL